MASPENVCCELFELFEQHNEQNKRAHARVAYMVWITSGSYLYVTTPGVSLLSVAAAGFFILGIFAAFVVVGRGGYLAHRAMSAALEDAAVFPDPRTAIAITTLCWLILIAEVVLSYELAKAAFDSFIVN